jgi:hypothetical protein
MVKFKTNSRFTIKRPTIAIHNTNRMPITILDTHTHTKKKATKFTSEKAPEKITSGKPLLL